MLSHVDQAFLHDAKKFAAYALRHIEFFKVGDKSGAIPVSR